MCIPPSDPSYAEALTFCGTMVEIIYPTGLSPPSDLLPFIIDPYGSCIRISWTDINPSLLSGRICARVYLYTS